MDESVLWETSTGTIYQPLIKVHRWVVS